MGTDERRRASAGPSRAERRLEGIGHGVRGRRRGAPGGKVKQWAAPRARRRRDLGVSRDVVAGEVSRAGARKGEERGSARWKRGVGIGAKESGSGLPGGAGRDREGEVRWA